MPQPLDGEPSPAPDTTGGLAADVRRDREMLEAARFGRYTDLAFLGAGGMANVYRAHDPVLGRAVALKFIRGDDPALATRLLSEARAQARIEHPHVCRVYEAGEQEGRAYIAMQYVDGRTLRDARAELTLEQKLKVIKEAAEGVHAAHRVGIVHRDLKPSNVMLQRGEDGGWFPYVMDFGIAREVAAPGLTLTGATLGTPWYMSPEQARGRTEALDRRSDVYSLGATLYDLVAGKPPYDGASSVDIMMQLLTEDPVPLAVRDPSIPADVRTIVAKAMEKEPARRYDSARALADDLGRYLDGEPIAARPPGALERVLRRARRNKTAFLTAGVAAVLVLVSGGAAVRARHLAREEAALAAAFARDVQDIDWLLRTAYMAPLHDVSAEKRQVRERLLRIERTMSEVGATAAGPGEYALGRGQLVLGDAAAARVHLERAWAAGYRPPEAAYALGSALGALYRRELEAADGIGAKELREARRREIETSLRDPALALLREGAASGIAPPEYVAGLIAFYERRHEEAVARAEEAVARAPWFHEARLLEGDVYAVLSRQRHETGAAEASREALEQAEASYRAAADHARSDPAAREGLCQIFVQRMEWEVYRGADLTGLFEQARGACHEAAAVDPERGAVHAKLANIHRFRANALSGRGDDPRAALDEAIAHARKAIALEPDHRGGHGNLGIAYRLRAAWESSQGLDPSASFASALAGLSRAAELAPDAGSFNDLANVYVTRAGTMALTGGDPRPNLLRGIEGYDKALALVPDYGYAHANRGLAWTDVAWYEIDHGLSPDVALANAIRDLGRSVSLLPHLEGVHLRLAEAHLARADYQTLVGGDPAPDVARARALLADARRVNPQPGPGTLSLAGQVALSEARAALEVPAAREQAPSAVVPELVREASSQFEASLRANATRARPHRLLAEAGLVEARWRLARGQDPRPALDRAARSLSAAQRLEGDDVESWSLRAGLHRWRAQSDLAAGRPPDAELSRAREATGRVFAQRPDHAPTQAILALVESLAGREAEAAAARARALELNAHLARRLDAEWPRRPAAR